MKSHNYVLITKFAEDVGLSRQAVIKSAKLLEYRKKINGRVYIHIDAYKLYGINYCVSTITRPRNDLRNTGETVPVNTSVNTLSTAQMTKLVQKLVEKVQFLTEELNKQKLLLSGGKTRTKRIKIIPVK